MAANTQESLSSFFNHSLLGDDDDIDKIKWVTAFNKLSINMTKKDVIKIFDYIDEEQVGFIDRFDFMEFCNTNHFQNKPMKRLKDILISRIEAFLRFQQIANDSSIEIIYSKHTVNPCKSINNQTPQDPYYTRYYEDDIFHDFDPQEYEMLQIKNCLCCSHCGKQFDLYTIWKKHESKCKYDAEKYVAYLLRAVEEDFDISFLDSIKPPKASLHFPQNGYNIIPPPPPQVPPPQNTEVTELPPPPPPLEEYVIRYNDNEMAEILSQIPDKVAIWSRLFASTQHPFVAHRLQCIQKQPKSYIKCIKSSAVKDYRDALQKKMCDLLLSTSTRNHTSKQSSLSTTKTAHMFPRVASIKITTPTTQTIAEIASQQATFQETQASLQHLSPIQHIQSSKIRYINNVNQINAFKLDPSTTALTPDVHNGLDAYIPKYIGDVEESGIDDYEMRVSDYTVDETTDCNMTKQLLSNRVSISKPAFYSDNESAGNQYKGVDMKKQLEYLRSKSSVNLIIIPTPNTPETVKNNVNHTNTLITKYQTHLQNEEQQTVGQQTLGTNDSDDDSSSLSELDDINAMLKDTKSAPLKHRAAAADRKSSETEVSSLPSATDEDDEEKEKNMDDHKENERRLKVIKQDREFNENSNSNPLAIAKKSGYYGSVDLGSVDLTELMSINPLVNTHKDGIDSPITPADALSPHNTDTLDTYDSSLGLYGIYYEQVIDLILQYSGLTEAVYVDGFLQLHEMVFDIYTHEYNSIWYKYRLPLWLQLLFDQKRLNELEKHYLSNGKSNNYEHGKLKWIYNLYDMIYYEETLFTHLIHCYGIPPTLTSVIWYHLSHNHHMVTDLDVFVLDEGIEWKQSDAPVIDYVFDTILESIYSDPVQSCLLKSYIFQPYLHHRARSHDIQRIMNGTNKRKLLPNLYYSHYRYVFYYHILYVLLRSLWSELPLECQQIIYKFWSKIQQETNGNNEWLFGDHNTIHKLLTNKLTDCQFLLTTYLWDGMCGIAILLTSMMLIAIHSKQSIQYFYKTPLLETETDKLCKVYRYLYDYIVYKSDYEPNHDNNNDASVSWTVIQKLCHLL